MKLLSIRNQAIFTFILLSVLSIFLVYEAVQNALNSDQWGLTFTFVTLPLAILGIIAIVCSIKILLGVIKGRYNNRSNKVYKPLLCLLLIAVIILLPVILMYGVLKSAQLDQVPDSYIAVFHGGAGEITYSTYIYKIPNDSPNYGFAYINTQNTTTSYGSAESTIEIISRGTVGWTDEVFSVAAANHAYSYVELPNSDRTYTIDEFMPLFLMN